MTQAAEIGVGLLGPAGIGQAHAHAYTLVRQVLWPPASVPRLLGSYLIDLARFLVGEPAAVSGARRCKSDVHRRPLGSPQRAAPPGRDGGCLRGDGHPPASRRI